jgi:predicted dehydrogenase
MFKAAIIGCGKIAGGWNDDPKVKDVLTHAKAYVGNQETQLVACADADARRAGEFAERWGIPKNYGDYREMLKNEEAGLISVCTPAGTHYQVVKDIAAHSRSVKAILLEKPMAETAEQAREMIRLCRQKGILINIDYPRRFDRNHQLIRKMIEEGELGGIQAVVAHYTKGIRNNGSHLVNLLRFFFGDISGACVLGSLSEVPDDPTPTLSLKAGKAPCYVVGLREGCYTVFEMEIFGEKKRVSMMDCGDAIFVDRIIDDPRYPGYRIPDIRTKPLKSTLGSAMANYLANTINAVKGTEKPLCDGEAGLKDVEAIEGILKLTGEKHG